MRLKSLTYAEYEGRPLEWLLDDLTLGAINLIVGKNAAGKTRTLNVIGALAQMLSNARKPGLASDYNVVFEHDDQAFRYELIIADMKVVRERLTVDKTVKLDRGEEGKGHIFAEKIDGGKRVRFQTPQDELAAAARRDGIQHSFLQPLYEWASSLKYYSFGTDLGKSQVAVLQGKNRPDMAATETDVVLWLFDKGAKKFGKRFQRAIVKDMGMLGYPIQNIGLGAPVSFRLTPAPPADLLCLFVQEKDLSGITDQNSMSQGMFRIGDSHPPELRPVFEQTRLHAHRRYRRGTRLRSLLPPYRTAPQKERIVCDSAHPRHKRPFRDE